MSKFEVKDNDNKVTITLDGDNGDISVGGNGQDAQLLFKDKATKIKGYIAASNSGGQISLAGPDGKQRFFCGAGNLHVGGNGADGDLFLHPAHSSPAVFGQLAKPTVKLSGENGEIYLRSGDQNRMRLDANGNAYLGGNGADGDLVLFASDGDNGTLEQSTIHLDGQNSKVTFQASGQKRLQLDGSGGNIWLGGNGADGDLVLFPSGATDFNDLTQASIHLDGQTGDIILQNADCAEDFDVAPSEKIDPGTVMVLDQEGALRTSREPYDKKVAGVISGAGDYRPGIILDKKHAQRNRMPVALMGKVYCKVDAQYSAIEVGDLLTTSPTAGHAMKASDSLRAFGAVIGKALRPLSKGQGLIPILIALQ